MIEPPQPEETVSSEQRPADLVESIRQLLEHLYDLPYLQQHILTVHPAVKQLQASAPPSQNLRRLLMSAIDTLKPPDEHSGSLLGRHYSIVHLHYVDGMTIQEAAHHLGVSLRQAYRDLQRGIEAVASVVAEQLAASEASASSRATAPMSIQSEVERLVPKLATLDTASLLTYAERAVQRLALQRNISLQVQLPDMPIMVRTDEVVAQQLLVRVLSQIIQSSEAQTLKVLIGSYDRSVELVIQWQGSTGELEAVQSDSFSTHLFNRLGWSYHLSEPSSDAMSLFITIPTDLRFLLVIDDNESLGELLDRYLTDMPYKLIAVTAPDKGLRLAHDLVPDVIMLDIMMPEMDGWQILQRLRNSPKTEQIPVIICSVFNDPELAYSLGATVFLPKPFSRENLIDALMRLEA